jgi:heptosyltransferase III
MQTDSNILDLLAAESFKAELKTKRALIIQPGAIGDCILTLPLASFMKNVLHLGGVDFLGHTEYIGIFPGRTCIDGIYSIDSIDLHRLFIDSKDFVLADRDPLIKTFSEYSWILSFMGEPESNFEKNLIFTTNCSHTAEIITLASKPTEEPSEHLTDFFIKQLCNQCSVSLEEPFVFHQDAQIKATKTDITKGKDLLWEFGLEPQKKLVVIQPGGGALDKCWNVENYLALVNELRSRNTQVVFLLGPAEVERFSNEIIQSLTNATKCLAELPLAEVLKILTCTDSFIGNDSGITHLAAAMGVNTLVVFGPTNPNVYKPIGPHVKVFTDNDKNFSKKPSVKLQEEITKVLLTDVLHTLF